MSKKILTILALGLAVLVGALAPPAAQAHTGHSDRATHRIADRLNGKHLGDWLATTLSDCDVAYSGPRHAEIVKIPAGHGRRWVGIIHVSTTTRANRVRAALECQDVWFTQGSGGRFVLPLRDQYYTSGGSGDTYRQTARWAKRRLGDGWVVR